MAGKSKPPRIDQLSYERLPDETAKAFGAFRIYRDMGRDRSLNNVRISLAKPESYVSTLANWSTQHAWVERSKLYDDWVDTMDRQEREASRPRWEELRQKALLENTALVERLRERVKEMIEHPLTKERVETSADGRSTTYIVPAGWTWGSVATVIKTMAELEAATIAEGLLDEESAQFDPATASLEECREFIAKQLKRTNNKQQPE